MALSAPAFSADVQVQNRFQEVKQYTEDMEQELDTVFDEYAKEVRRQLNLLEVSDTSSALSALESPNLGEAPLPQEPGAFVSQAQTVSLSDITALRQSLELGEVEVLTLDLPPLEAVAPSLPKRDEPTVSDVVIPEDVPNVGDPELPDKPTYTMPSDAEIQALYERLEAVTVPEVPATNRVGFEGVEPSQDITPPEPMLVYSEATYASDVKDALKTKLYNDIANGGTGLDSDTEQAIIDNALDLFDVELENKLDSTLEFWAARGHDLPPGIAVHAAQENINERNRQRTRLLNDITKIQFDVTQQNTQFAVTNGLVFEKQLMDLSNQVADRSFQYARFRVEGAKIIHDMKIAAHAQELALFQAHGQVLEAKIRGELLELEGYLKQIDGKRLTAEFTAQMAEILNQRYRAIELKVAIYEKEMEGARLRVDVDRARIEGFQAVLSAKQAQIALATAKYNLYQAKIAGDEAKVRIFSEQVRAYSSQVEALKAKADVNRSNQEAQLAKNKESIEVLRAAVEKYIADQRHEVAKDEIAARAHASDVDKYRAEIDRLNTFISATVDKFRAQTQQRVEEARALIEESRLNQQTQLALKEIVTKSIEAAMNVRAQLLASAMSAVSASAQVGFNESLTQSYSESSTV